ncbi:MAG: hypothetical protein ACREVZ_00040 [Burkholderiales bacterium]
MAVAGPGMVCVKRARIALLLCGVLACTALAGCGIFERLTGQAARDEARAETARQQSEALQQKVMRFADQHIESVARQTGQLARELQQSDRRIEILEWRSTNATAAVLIAAGPKPVTNAVDMVVMVSLSRRIVQSRWVQRYGEPAQPVLRIYQSEEQEAWRLLDGIGTEQQHAELRAFLDSWFDENRGELSSAAFIRFADFISADVKTKAGVSASLLGIVGLDPIAGIDPAVREVAQTRLLAERTVYYAQRLPVLLDFHATLATARIGATPEAHELLGTIDELGQLSSSLTRLSDSAPEILSKEREAAIAQFMGELARQQQDMLALTRELRSAIEAGAVTADALNALAKSTDTLMARFKPGPDASPTAKTLQPFDINEYTRTITELAAAAHELRVLVADIDSATPRIAGVLDEIAGHTQALVNYILVRLLLLVGAIFLAALGYRWVSVRIARAGRPGSAD